MTGLFSLTVCQNDASFRRRLEIPATANYLSCKVRCNWVTNSARRLEVAGVMAPSSCSICRAISVPSEYPNIPKEPANLCAISSASIRKTSLSSPDSAAVAARSRIASRSCSRGRPRSHRPASRALSFFDSFSGVMSGTDKLRRQATRLTNLLSTPGLQRSGGLKSWGQRA